MRAVDSNAFLLEVLRTEESLPSPPRYPFTIPALRSFESLELHPRVTFFVGENGSGKSTLIEAMAVSLGINPEGGSKNFCFGTRDSHSELHKYLRIAKGVKRPKDYFFLRAESLFNVGTEIERLDEGINEESKIAKFFGGVSLHEQSHGESFLAVLNKRFFGNGLYLLDEPEAALSPTRQLAALRAIHLLVEESSQFIICTHSPILMAYPDAWIYQLDGDGIRRVEYRETEHYAVTKEFLERPERMLERLLGEE